MRFSLRTLTYTVAMKNMSLKMQAGVGKKKYKGQFCFSYFKFKLVSEKIVAV